MQPMIKVENLSKAYRIGVKENTQDTLVGAAKSIITAPLRNFRQLSRLDTGTETMEDTKDIIWAMRDVSFEVNEGDVVGIIGRNGAGKSTLLKLLSRITEPTRGRATIRGRVSSLLEVGTGFHPDLSGHENIYMNGTILGMRKREIDEKFDEIVEFSGIEKFLETPIKRYSSGMKVRLAFSVAAHLEPEILIIDEVLAVGDVPFQKKCLGRMHEVAGSGRTVLFVSHSMAAVEGLCNRGLMFDQGRLKLQGEIRQIIDAYEAELSNSDWASTSSADLKKCRLLESVRILDEDGQESAKLRLGTEFHVVIGMNCLSPVREPRVWFGIDDAFGNRVLTCNTPASREVIGTLSGQDEVHCKIANLPVPPGHYSLTVGVRGFGKVHNVLPFLVVDGDAFGEGRGFEEGVCMVPSEWWRD